MNEPDRPSNPVGCLMGAVVSFLVLGALLSERGSKPEPPKIPLEIEKWDQNGLGGANWPLSGAASSIITFDNQSGEPALVRLVGPTRAEVDVPNGGRKSTHGVAPGRYVIRVRYGTPGTYRYTEGEPFEVHASAFSYSHVTITLHRVRNGNYTMRPSSEVDFAAAAP